MRLLIAICAALSLSCNPRLMPSESRVPQACDAAGPYLETLTWNVGLAPGVVPLATPRIVPVAQEVARFRDVGLVCLQEVWTDEARDAVLAALALPEERVYYVDTSGQGDDLSGVNVCRPGQVDDLAACARSACAGWPDEEHARCALDACGDEIVSLYLRGGENCLGCLVSSVGESIDGTVRACTAPAPGVTHSYGGRNGVMLVSRWPLVRRESILLPSSIANRAALFASVELEGRETLEVACAHLSTWNRLPPSHRGPDGRKMFDDWDEEMIAQVDIIARKLAERAKGRPQLFLGDMNAAPGITKAMAEDMPKVWSRLVRHGFESPAVRAETPFCSVCRGNTLRDPSARDKLIDHVLVRDPVGGSRLMPVCTRSLVDGGHLRYFPGYDGRMVEEHLSDHYAVSVTFRYD
jgi:hypothetical protein